MSKSLSREQEAKASLDDNLQHLLTRKGYESQETYMSHFVFGVAHSDRKLVSRVMGKCRREASHAAYNYLSAFESDAVETGPPFCAERIPVEAWFHLLVDVSLRLERL